MWAMMKVIPFHYLPFGGDRLNQPRLNSFGKDLNTTDIHFDVKVPNFRFKMTVTNAVTHA